MGAEPLFFDTTLADLRPVLDRREAGILLHITSLPGPGLSGDLGPSAFHFIKFLAASGMRVWQTLPLGPTHEDGSPYQALSVHAGNRNLISLDVLAHWGWLPESELLHRHEPDGLTHCLQHAWRGFCAQDSEQDRSDLEAFIKAHSYWLDDYALFVAIKKANNGAQWLAWPEELRNRDKKAIERMRIRMADELTQIRFEQFVFFRQWRILKKEANKAGVRLFGDLPIFVAHDSADVWAHRDEFLLNDDGSMSVVTGVPPDYFSETGQRWGNPHYDWDHLHRQGYEWWIERIRTQLELYDLLRIDHFRGLEACWEIPVDSEFATAGHWVDGPGESFFMALRLAFGNLPIIAEDLGTITPEVEALREQFGIPGMRVLQFGFSDDPLNPHVPFNYDTNSVAYTGTHDNDTTLSWYQSLDESTQQAVQAYLGVTGDDMPWPMIRCTLASTSQLAILPMQDVLGLGTGHRMNMPGTTEGNWSWRFSWDQISAPLAGDLHGLLATFGRHS